MERSLASIGVFFVVLVVVSSLTVAAPPFGLSTTLSVSVLGSSVMGSSVLGSSMVSTTVLVEAYSSAIVASQLWLSLVVIGLLFYVEISDPTYGKLRKSIVEFRKSWLPISALLSILFFVIVALKIYSILLS